MKTIVKLAFVVGLALLCMCIYNDSTPSEAIEDVSTYIGSISNNMEGGYDRQYNSNDNRVMGFQFSMWYINSTLLLVTSWSIKEEY